jgi:hypothetical protein
MYSISRLDFWWKSVSGNAVKLLRESSNQFSLKAIRQGGKFIVAQI